MLYFIGSIEITENDLDWIFYGEQVIPEKAHKFIWNYSETFITENTIVQIFHTLRNVTVV